MGTAMNITDRVTWDEITELADSVRGGGDQDGVCEEAGRGWLQALNSRCVLCRSLKLELNRRG